MNMKHKDVEKTEWGGVGEVKGRVVMHRIIFMPHSGWKGHAICDVQAKGEQ